MLEESCCLVQSNTSQSRTRLGAVCVKGLALAQTGHSVIMSQVV